MKHSTSSDFGYILHYTYWSLYQTSSIILLLNQIQTSLKLLMMYLILFWFMFASHCNNSRTLFVLLRNAALVNANPIVSTFVNGDANAHAENRFKPILCVNVCITNHSIQNLTQTLTLTQTQMLSVNRALNHLKKCTKSRTF